MGDKNKEFETITPAQLDLSAVPHSSQANAEPASWLKSNINTILSGIALILALIVVVYLLPNQIDKSKSEETITPKATPTAPVLTGKEESPWAEAQASRERKQAQKILLDILSLQEQLEEKSVQRWGQDEYGVARETATQGDERYRKRQFDTSKIKYEESLALMQTLLEKAEIEFETQLKTGESALLEEDSKNALKAFELALAIDNSSEKANLGLARAKNLDQVVQLSKRATNLLHAGELDEALSVAEEVVALDSAYEPIKTELSAIKQAITDRSYGQKMSEGYAALNKKNYAKAKKYFQAAKKIKPTEAGANNALIQVANQATQHNIKALMDTARQYEAEENWGKAINAYDEALKQDKSLVQATVGRLKAKARFDLDTELNKLIDAPLRLSNDIVYRDALGTLRDAKAMKNPGPKLNNQIEALTSSLERAQTPIDVAFKSDNSTDVTLLRIGHLGTFETHKLSLKPGKYVAIGKRPEYRDVRQEFTINLDDTAPEIVVRCDEKIIKTP